VVLEITRACNIRCRGCYKLRREQTKPLDEVYLDVDVVLEKLPVQTVSIAGAEPTLHPQLCEIVRHLKSRDVATALITNGLVLDDAYLSRLKCAGLDVVMFHVDEGQRRPDLPRDPTVDEVNRLRVCMTQRAARHGLDTGLSVTLYPDTLARLPDLVRLIVEAEHIHFLFATSYADVHGMMRHPPRADRRDRTGNVEVMKMLRDSLGLEPFASLGGSHWLSYFVPVLYRRGAPRVFRLRAGPADSLLLRLPRMLAGRHIFYCRSRPLTVGVQMAVNQLSRGEVRSCVEWLRGIWRGHARLDAKRMVFDNGPVMEPDGAVACFDICPNRTVNNGTLVPVCASDYHGVS
jgi:pyruvate-formate lyase-activating enzyme